MQPNKKILFGYEAKKALLTGINMAGNAVGVTLGPIGKNVAIGRLMGAPLITNDGVSIVNSIKLKNRFENMGVEIAKQTASKTDSVAGDGTTTTILLLQNLFNVGIVKMDNSDNPDMQSYDNVIQIKKDMEDTSSMIIEEMTKNSRKVESKEQIFDVANISVEDENVANLITDIFVEGGKTANVIVMESEKSGVIVEKSEGMKINKGYAANYVINRYEKMTGEYSDLPVVITNTRVMNSEPFAKVLDELSTNGAKSILFIADDIDGEALVSFQLTAERAGLVIIPVRFSVFGEGKKEELEDIAIKCGAKIINAATKPDEMINFVGHANKCVVSRDSTIISTDSDVSKRVEELSVYEANTEDEKRSINSRIANLQAKVYTIKVGAETEAERKYLKLKIDDAVNATRGAIEEGIISGGGVALFNATKAVEKHMIGNPDFKEGISKGARIVIDAAVKPYQQIITNSLYDLSMVNEEDLGKPIDAKKGVFIEDAFAVGIVDPLKVTKNALKNATSAAAMLLTTEVLIAEDDDVNYEQYAQN